MKAAVLRQFGEPLGVEDIELDEPMPDEVVVRVHASGVCHTDRTMQLGAQPLPLPHVLGHEVAGVVERTGRDVTSVRAGDHVVVCASAFCGTCEWCLRGLPQHCDDKRRTRPPGLPPRLSRQGEAVHGFVGIGGFAEQLLVHERALVKIPGEMPLDRAALLGCAVVTGVGGVLNCARVRAGQTVAVIGCGGVGLNAVQAARLVGAARIIAIDRLPAKLALAQEFGATDVVDASAVDPVEAVRELTGGGVDHAVEVVGRSATIEQAFAMLRTRGTATVIGVARPEDTVRIPATDLLLEKRLQGTKMGSSRFRLDVPMYCGLYLDGRLKLDELLSARSDLASVTDALVALDSSTGARTVITF